MAQYYKYSIYLFALCLTLLSSCSDDDDAGKIKNKQNNQSVGHSANDLLTAAKYDKMIIEVLFVAGHEPTEAAMSNLKSFMESVAFKPAGISIAKREISIPEKDVYSLDELISYENTHRTVMSSGNTISVYMLFVNGNYTDSNSSTTILGIAYRNTSIVMFQKPIESLSGGLGQPSRATLETAVGNHELGHVLGLVNVGTPLQSQHQDVQHGKHCDNNSCLMHYTVETGDVITNLLGGNIPELDAACKADLRANGGK